MRIVLHRQERVAYLTIENPPLNVLNLSMLHDFENAMDSLEGDPGVDLLVIRGAGERAFSAGVDVKDHTRERVPEMLKTVHGVIRKLLSLPQVTIAQVRGACLGGGCELAASCDLILASEDSFFATPEINVGCYPPVALARFPFQIGYYRAAEMILTGRRLSAREALEAGLITRLASANDLETALGALLVELQSKSRAVLRIALRGLRETVLKSFVPALERAEDLYLHELIHTNDMEEGVRAFLEKRKPDWKHR